jgi:hypothetical protein
MVLPKNVKPEDVFHPTGVFFRNPTHTEEADNARDQSQIVKSLTGAKRDRITETLSYEEDDKPWVLPGFKFIRTMKEEDIKELCKNLMRFRPNIFKVHIKLGEYQKAKRIETSKTRNLSSFEPRFPSEVAEKMAEVLSDRNLNVTEIIYTVTNADAGSFQAIAEVYGMVSDEDYENDKLFNPGVLVQYFSN